MIFRPGQLPRGRRTSGALCGLPPVVGRGHASLLTTLDTGRSKTFRDIHVGHPLIYTADSYGSSSAVPTITVDADGRITAACTEAVRGVLSTAHLADAVKLDPGPEEQAARERLLSTGVHHLLGDLQRDAGAGSNHAWQLLRPKG